MTPPTPFPDRLRERKKRATRAAIQGAAFALFLERGYDETTTDEIARAADVAPSTLFNYFPTKAALVADGYGQRFIHLLRSRPPGEPMFTAIRNAIESGLATIVDEDRDLVVARTKLALRVPALRAAVMVDNERAGTLLRTILAARSGRGVDDFEIKVTGAIIVSAMVTAMDEWLESDGKGRRVATHGTRAGRRRTRGTRRR
jgi:AcrR family transcriptional regulator